jgi:hypothetical protein
VGDGLESRLAAFAPADPQWRDTARRLGLAVRFGLPAPTHHRRRRPFIASTPPFVIAAFALMPAAAQAHEAWWYKNGVLLKEGVKTPVVTYGGAVNLSMMSDIGALNCRNAGGGIIENPAGGGHGIGTTPGSVFFECKAAGCEKAGEEDGLPLELDVVDDAGTTMIEDLTGEGSSEHETIGEPFTSFSEYGKPVTKGELQMRVSCETPPGYEPHVVGVSATFQGELSPRIGPGHNGTSGTKPSTMEFSDASTGALHSEIGGEGTISGSIKYVGYNSQELLTAE